MDTRLRPSGRAGLVSSFEAFAEYQQRQAWTWGTSGTGTDASGGGTGGADRAISSHPPGGFGAQARSRGAAPGSPRHARERMRAELDASTAEIFDLKQGRGGIADINLWCNIKSWRTPTVTRIR